MDLHVIMHVPKTGGQTIRNQLCAHLELGVAFVHVGPFGDKHARERGLTLWKERSDTDREQVRVLAGHDLSIHTPDLVPGNRNVKFVGMFRDPAARMVSNYNYNVQRKWEDVGKPAPDWAWWYRGQKRNFISRWIKEKFLARTFDEGQSDESLFEEIAAALDGFWLLGTMPHFDAFVAKLHADIGLPPASEDRWSVAGRNYPVRLTLSEDIQRQVARDHPVDCAIYDLVQRRVDAVFGAADATNR